MVVANLLLVLIIQGATTAHFGDSKIVGGQDVPSIRKYPYLLKVNNIQYGLQSAGSLLTLSYALTCCHCIFKLPCKHTCRPRHFYKPYKQFTYEEDGWIFIAGTTQFELLHELIQDDRQVQIRGAKKLMHHPRCAMIGGIIVFDLGLGELTKPFNLTIFEVVRPIRLLDVTSTGFESKFHRLMNISVVRCESLGWGLTNVSDKRSFPSNLRVISTNYSSQAECTKHYGYDLAQYYHVCVASNEGSTCRGDPGSPLICGGFATAALSAGSRYCTRGARSLYQLMTPMFKWIASDFPQLAEELGIPKPEEEIPVTCPERRHTVVTGSRVAQLDGHSAAALTFLLFLLTSPLQTWFTMP